MSSTPGVSPYSGWPGVREPSWRKRGDVVEAEIEPEEVEQRVLEHRRVPVREHEAIAQRPGGIARVEAEVVVPELEGRRSERHGSAHVTDPGALDGVHREESDRVLDLPEQRSVVGSRVRRGIGGGGHRNWLSRSRGGTSGSRAFSA